MLSRRSLVIAAIAIVFLLAVFTNQDVVTTNFSPSGASSTAVAKESTSTPATTPATIPAKTTTTTSTLTGGFKDKDSPLSPEVLNYFDQVFNEKPVPFGFPELKAQCEHTKWPEDDVYLQCGAMSAGLTSIVSQVKVCFKMAVEAGVGLVLPAMPLRDSKDLTQFNFMNGDAYLGYDKWFDGEFLREQIGRICPKMKILHPDQVGTIMVPLKNKWNIDIGKAPGYQQFNSYFWAGRPFKAFFDQEFAKLAAMAEANPSKDPAKTGITTITIASNFLLFRITDDPTHHDLKLWNDLGALIRYREAPRKIVASLLAEMKRPYYGVHFRAENDTIWSSPDHQMQVDLDALDKAWKIYGKDGQEKPLVYLACGDQGQIDKFVTAGKARGWDVTHKWALAKGNEETTKMINDLPFDFQGAVDQGIMVRSHFFLGITGSAFSSSIGNARDVTGRYRGSSFNVFDDGNARTHLFNDGDASHYACCL